MAGWTDLWAERAEQIYFLYQKIASATKATVMIHRTMSLLRFFSFSSAIAESTPYLKARFKCCLDFLTKYERYGLVGPPVAASRLYPVNFTTSLTCTASTRKCKVSSTRA